MMGVRVTAALLATVVLIGGCKMLPKIEPPRLGISNGTKLTVTLVVNGQVVGVFRPGEGASPLAIPLPQLPWAAEARTSTGRLLTSFQVAPGQVFRTTMPDGSILTSGGGARLDLSCGRLDVWAGEQPGGPAPGPGHPGDCVP
jgi:hypothetical protein